ncbi:hypothetical protein AALA13_02480 [Lachnospiraceae bacterium 50-23]|jgi:hypothetical protein|nr:hypothetical protein [Dorea sp.]GFI36710.1 hypothetical protein IMSAGC015_00887 [Lachnospiraceae bacterium]
MLDENRVKLMTRLALYEQTEGKEDFKISEYYKSDYIGMHIICSILWVTVGYVGIGVLVVLAGLEDLMAKMSMGLLVTLMIGAVAGYLATVIIFAVVTRHIYNKRHQDARQRVKLFNHDLIKLLKLYEKEKK